MSIRTLVVLFTVLFGLASSANTTESADKAECVDNTLYTKYICEQRTDGERLLVPGKCSQYYECSKGVSKLKTCSKFYDPETKKCVSQSSCVEVDNTDCVIPTPPPCHQTPATCPPPTECPPPPTECPVCPPPTECPEPEPPCPSPPTPSPPTPSPEPCNPGGPCDPEVDPNDLYGSYVCRHKPDGTKLITLTSCRDYYYCIRGFSYRKSCGINQYFDPKFGACDDKSSVYCPSDKKMM